MTDPRDWQKPTELSGIISCKQAARLVSISFERQLSCREWLAMRFHLLMCRTCSFYARQIKGLRSVFLSHGKFLDAPSLSDNKLSDEAGARIKKSLCHIS